LDYVLRKACVEKATAKGFFELLWEEGGQQEYLTAVMMDLL